MFRFYRNLFFTIIWIAFFSFYYSYNYDLFKRLMMDKINLPDASFSYIAWIIGFFFTIWIVWLINRTTESFINKVFKENSTVLLITEFVVRFISITKFIFAFYVFSYFAVLPETLKIIANKWYSISIIIIFVVFATWFVNKFFTDDLIKKSKLKALSRTLLPFVNKAIVIFIWVIWIITVFDNVGYDITALVAWAWIWGLAIAFAAQKSISNVFWAITILLNKPFKIWDYVIVNWVEGTVKDIWLSYLTLIERSWHQVMIPNETIISTNVENFSVRENRRTDSSIWLEYWTTIEKMKKWVQIIEEILEEQVWDEKISSYRVNFDMFWDFSLNIVVTYFSLIKSPLNEYLKQKEYINLEIKKRFKIAKLEMAFPTQELIIKK